MEVSTCILQSFGCGRFPLQHVSGEKFGKKNLCDDGVGPALGILRWSGVPSPRLRLVRSHCCTS